ncbi:MAG TPA: hypothetical protein VLE96_01175 [Chlamydiales bacterium]|nr:hypothetical protein [Chlamydiales bacterium]
MSAIIEDISSLGSKSLVGISIILSSVDAFLEDQDVKGIALIALGADILTSIGQNSNAVFSFPITSIASSGLIAGATALPSSIRVYLRTMSVALSIFGICNHLRRS